MEFKDFTPEELVDKLVLYSDGMGGCSIAKIDRVTKAYFGISRNDMLFKLASGKARGDSGWR